MPHTALLIGIDYLGTKIATNYNTHDVKRIRADLLSNYESVRCLTDDLPEESELYPIHQNIVRELENFYSGAPAQHYLFVFCGASRDKYDKIKDEDGLTLDRKTRVVPAILPRGKETPVIDSTQLRDLLVERLPAGASLTCIFSANYGHQLLPMTFEYNFRKGEFIGDAVPNNKNILSIAFSSDEFNPVEMKLSSPDKPTIFGSMGIFSMLGIQSMTLQYDGEITREGYLQALLKNLVGNNPTPNKTFNLMTCHSEDKNLRCKNFYIL